MADEQQDTQSESAEEQNTQEQTDEQTQQDEGQATAQTQENLGTQGQPTVAEDGVEHNQHIQTPEEQRAEGEEGEKDDSEEE